MPHLTLEFTGNIEQEIPTDGLFARLHRVLGDVGGVPLGNCKSRAIRLDDYYLADGDPRHAFAHLTIRFMAGRPVELKQEISRQSLAVLQEAFAPSFAQLELQVTVEVQDIERATYGKIPEGTL